LLAQALGAFEDGRFPRPDAEPNLWFKLANSYWYRPGWCSAQDRSIRHEADRDQLGVDQELPVVA